MANDNLPHIYNYYTWLQKQNKWKYIYWCSSDIVTHKNNINDKERKDLTRLFIKLSYDIMNTLKVRSTKNCITSSIPTNKDAFLISTMHEHNFNVWGSNLMTWPEFTWLNPIFLRALHLMCHVSKFTMLYWIP